MDTISHTPWWRPGGHKESQMLERCSSGIGMPAPAAPVMMASRTPQAAMQSQEWCARSATPAPQGQLARGLPGSWCIRVAVGSPSYTERQKVYFTPPEGGGRQRQEVLSS